MELEVLEKTDTRIKFNLPGAGHTFCNNLKRQLNRDSSVDVAAYTVEHPLIGVPTFIISLKKKGDFDKILKSAVKDIKQQNADTKKLVQKL